MTRQQRRAQQRRSTYVWRKGDITVVIGNGQTSGGRTTRWAIHCTGHGWLDDTYVSKTLAARYAGAHIQERH